MALPAWLRGARAAFVFLTRLPVGGFPYADADWRWSSGHYPLVGAVVGLCESGIALSLRSHLGDGVASCVAIGFAVMFTGAIHEDGLADTADGWWGGKNSAQMLKILKDSRIGSYGACALVLSLALRLMLMVRCLVLAQGRWPLVVAALTVAQCLSRWVPVALMASLPYVSHDGSKSDSVMGTGWPQVALASLWWALPIILGWRLAENRIFLCIPLALVCWLCLRWAFRQKLGGITGDLLGASQVVSNLSFLVLITFN